jgi:hypothetical protein
VGFEETIMKMLTIVCGEKIEDEILMLFGDLAIQGYTVVSDVGGSGQTGVVSGKGAWTDRNKLYLIALDDEHMAPLLKAVRSCMSGLCRSIMVLKSR